MTLRQYLAHLRWWLQTFPRWNATEHTNVGKAGGGVYRCLLCGAWEYVNEEDE